MSGSRLRLSTHGARRLLPGSPLARGVLGVLLALILYEAVAGAVNRLFPGPSGPAASAYATTPGGVAGLAQVLQREGHPVKLLRTAPARSQLDPRSAVFVLEPSGLTTADKAALRRFVSHGGRLVAGGADPQAWLAGLVADPPVWIATSARRSARAARDGGHGSPLPAGVRTVATTGAPPPGARPPVARAPSVHAGLRSSCASAAGHAAAGAARGRRHRRAAVGHLPADELAPRAAQQRGAGRRAA